MGNWNGTKQNSTLGLPHHQGGEKAGRTFCRWEQVKHAWKVGSERGCLSGKDCEGERPQVVSRTAWIWTHAAKICSPFCVTLFWESFLVFLSLALSLPYSLSLFLSMQLGSCESPDPPSWVPRVLRCVPPPQNSSIYWRKGTLYLGDMATPGAGLSPVH